MKKYTIVFLLSVSLACFSQDRYVSVDGNGSGNGDGTSLTNEWTLAQSFANATAGMTVHVRKGNYGEQRLSLANAGSAGNYLEFIGYNTTPNDLTTIDGEGSSYTYSNSALNGNTMPYLFESRPADGRSVGTSIHLNNNDYVRFENFMIENFNYGLESNGEHVILKNIITRGQGNFNATDVAERPFSSDVNGAYNGWGIVMRGDDSQMINCFSVNAAAQGISISDSNNWIANGCSVYADNNVNPLDYYFLIGQNTTNGQMLNSHVQRVSALNHQGHGICFKTANNSTGNVVDGFTIINTNLEIQFPGVTGNTFRNGKIFDNLQENADTGGINLANGSHSNHYENIYVKNRGVYFRDWADGLAGDVNISSYNNTFYNLAIEDAVWAVNFNHFQLVGDDSRILVNGAADDNTFYNCTWKNFNWMFQVSRPADNLQFINCVFTDGNTYKFDRGFPAQTIDDSYQNSTFFGNSFTTPSGTGPQNVDPLYQTGIEEEALIATNTLLLSNGIATPFDIDNTKIGFLGFDENEITVPPIEPELPSITKAQQARKRANDIIQTFY